MLNRPKAPTVAACFALTMQLAVAQQENESDRHLMHGPGEARLESIARIQLPEGYSFVDGAGTRALMKNAGEPVNGNEVGLIIPTNADWSVMFEFDKIGYVKDDDKDKLEPDKLLASIKRGTEEANKLRQRRGNPPLEIVGWEQPPRYDPETHNLEWAIRATSGGEALLNYNTRLLGRKGVMEVVLICSPDELAATLPKFKTLLSAYTFQSGQSYAEYRSGDKVAKYGLAALVVGGAAVGAAKLGVLAWLAVLLKKAWKLIVVAVAAVAGFIKKLFSRLSGRRSPDATA